MQGNVWRGGAVGVEPRHLLGFRNGHHVLAAVRLHQQGLLGGDCRGRQMLSPDLLRHQLLLDFIDQD